MIFSFSEEHGELRDGLRRFLTDKSPSTEVRRLMDTDEGYDPKGSQQLAQQLGVTGLTIPEKFGGLGYGAVEQAIVLEEMGRALLCAPYLSTAVLADGGPRPAATRPRRSSTCPASPRARRSPPWPWPRTTATGTPPR